jgi:histidinol-phosphatase (PHP family)
MSAEEVCQNALRIGIKELCFLEHLDFDPNDMSYGYYNYDKAMAEKNRLKAVYKNSLQIYSGVEVSYQEEYKDQIVNFIEGKDFDVITGSVHFVKRTFLPDWIKTVEDGEHDRPYRAYFEELRTTAESGLFDVIGHFDYFRRYSEYPHIIKLGDYRNEIVDIIDIMVEKNIGLEINTSGLRHPNQTIFPELDVVRRYRERGGKIVTIGSDAHRTVHLGFGLDLAVAHLKKAGFDAVAVFDRRKPKFIKP